MTTMMPNSTQERGKEINCLWHNINNIKNNIKTPSLY